MTEGGKSKFTQIVENVLDRIKGALLKAKDIAVALLKVSVPIGGGMIVSDILLGTKFNIIGRIVGEIGKVGINPTDLTKIIYVVGGVGLIMWVNKSK